MTMAVHGEIALRGAHIPLPVDWASKPVIEVKRHPLAVTRRYSSGISAHARSKNRRPD
jgi:hypothetical protein